MEKLTTVFVLCVVIVVGIKEIITRPQADVSKKSCRPAYQFISDVPEPSYNYILITEAQPHTVMKKVNERLNTKEWELAGDLQYSVDSTGCHYYVQTLMRK